MEEMERLLSVWMQDQHLVPIYLMFQEKAKSLYKDLKKRHSEESEGAPFNVSCGWFHWFKARANVYNGKVSGEAASTEMVAARKFPEMLIQYCKLKKKKQKHKTKEKKKKKLLMKARIYHSSFLMWMRQD